MKEKLLTVWSHIWPPLLQVTLIAFLLCWVVFVPYYYLEKHSIVTWMVPTIWGATFSVVMKALQSMLSDIYGRPKI